MFSLFQAHTMPPQPDITTPMPRHYFVRRRAMIRFHAFRLSTMPLAFHFDFRYRVSLRF